MNTGKIIIEKRSFLNNVGCFLNVREKVYTNFERKIFPNEDLDKTPTPVSTSRPTPKPKAEPTVFDTKLPEHFINKIKYDEKNINNEIFKGYFG